MRSCGASFAVSMLNFWDNADWDWATTFLFIQINFWRRGMRTKIPNVMLTRARNQILTLNTLWSAAFFRDCGAKQGFKINYYSVQYSPPQAPKFYLKISAFLRLARRRRRFFVCFCTDFCSQMMIFLSQIQGKSQNFRRSPDFSKSGMLIVSTPLFGSFSQHTTFCCQHTKKKVWSLPWAPPLAI